MDYTAFAQKARQNLIVAEWCYQQGHYDACCNRAYYVRRLRRWHRKALLRRKNRLITAGAQSQFVTYFCNRQKIFPKLRNYLADAQTRRNQADYRPEGLNQRKAGQQSQWANEFVHTVLRRMATHDES